jgi:hypothetical protein
VAIIKGALVEYGDPVPAALTLILLLGLVLSVTEGSMYHGKELGPEEFVVESVNATQSTPLRECSIFTYGMIPVESHLIGCVESVSHTVDVSGF